MALRRSFASAYLFQPVLYRRSRSESFKLCAQKLLHRLSLQGRATGKLIADPLRNIANGQLDSHACIMTALHAHCKRVVFLRGIWAGICADLSRSIGAYRPSINIF